MSPGEVTARGNRDVGKVGSLGKGPRGKRHAWKYHMGKIAQGKQTWGKCPGEVSLLPFLMVYEDFVHIAKYTHLHKFSTVI